MGEIELLSLPTPPWHPYNLRVVHGAVDGRPDGVTFARENPDKNGHLEQWCVVDHIVGTGTLLAALSLRAANPELVGVNIYLYFHPSDDEDRQVYQCQHPGDGAWHTLTKTIPLPERPLRRIRLMVVSRVGAGDFSLGSASLRFKSHTAEVEVDNQVSPAYHDAVMAMVDQHPSATDPAFRAKLSRYLLGCNRNGARTVAAVNTLLAPTGSSISGCRFLDLGSGTGGSLVAALKAGAAWCEGWEINADKRRLSEINVSTSGVDAARVVVHDRNMEGRQAHLPDFEAFEVVFCEEVLEHVKDLERAIATLARCIVPETGAGYITMPNGFALESVLADPHLQLFGIALLDRFEAQPFATALKKHTHYSEMMGTYCRYEDYVARFTAAGLRLEGVEDSDASNTVLASWYDLLAKIEARRNSLRTDWGGRVDEEHLSLLDKRLDAYLATARIRLNGAERSAKKRAIFARDYGQPHFAFLARHG